MTLSEIQEELLDEESVKAFDKKISRVFKVVSNLQQSYSARCIEFINSTQSPHGSRGSCKKKESNKNCFVIGKY